MSFPLANMDFHATIIFTVQVDCWNKVGDQIGLSFAYSVSQD